MKLTDLEERFADKLSSMLVDNFSLHEMHQLMPLLASDDSSMMDLCMEQMDNKLERKSLGLPN